MSEYFSKETRVRIARLLCTAVLSLVIVPRASSQKVYFPGASPTDTIALSHAMSRLAGDLLTVYRSGGTRDFGPNRRLALQILANEYSSAIASIDSLRHVPSTGDPKFVDFWGTQHELYSKAQSDRMRTGRSFEESFTASLRERLEGLSDAGAAHLFFDLLPVNGVEGLRTAFQRDLAGLNGKDSLTIDEATELCGNYCTFKLNSETVSISRKLLNEDDRRRYIIEDSVLVKGRNGASLSAVVVRKRNVDLPQPVLLEFTIYTGAVLALAKDAAANGYAGVVAFTRGKRFSPDEIVPYEHDGDDCTEVIDWISKQPWCNGKVGMYGGSYTGFTQWAAAKHLHPALKTIVPSASVAPGLDVPMMNNVFESFVFPWTYYVSNSRFLDYADYNNTAQWDSLYARWYASGKPYKVLDSLTGRGANKIFQSWIAHPGYDSYWQGMIPYRHEFSKITIPVLSTTGYYDGAQVGAMYYFREHYKYNKNARHYLIIGPYSHYGAQGFLGALPDSILEGYKIDPAANIPVHDIIYQWFDYILKEGPKPAILKDNVNYEVMGKNEWKHAATPAGMSNDTLRFYLNGTRSGNRYVLESKKPATKAFVPQEVDFADRKTVNNYDHTNSIILDSLDASNGLVFVSDPFKEPVEFSGNFSGLLKATINKKDMDYSVNVFELQPDGRYFYLSYFMGRASYARDHTMRRILKPGAEQSIPFTNTYMTSKQLHLGSRLVIVLNINKSPNEQINYGTGKGVSDESIDDAKSPLHVQWWNGSYVDIPVWK